MRLILPRKWIKRRKSHARVRYQIWLLRGLSVPPATGPPSTDMRRLPNAYLPASKDITIRPVSTPGLNLFLAV